MNSKLGRVALEKQGLVRQALLDLAKRDGVAVPKNVDLDALSRVYLLPIQCLWLRSYDVAFIEKYAVIVPRVSALLKKFDFNALVHAYRSNYTNLYTQKTSKGRKYSLSMGDFIDFVGKVENGKIVISVEKPQKENVVKNSLASQLFNSFSVVPSTTMPISKLQAPKTSTTTQVSKPQAPKTSTKTQKVKEKPIKKGFFTAIDMKTMEVSKFYRITTKQGQKLYVWLVGASKTQLELRDYKKVVVKVNIADITQVEGYTKAVWANR